MTTLVKADDKGRVPIRGTERGREYLVTAESGGWWVRPAPRFRPPRKRLKWPGSKVPLGEHLKGLAKAGLKLQQADNAKAPVPPCRF